MLPILDLLRMLPPLLVQGLLQLLRSHSTTVQLVRPKAAMVVQSLKEGKEETRALGAQLNQVKLNPPALRRVLWMCLV